MINLIIQYFKVKRNPNDKDYNILCKRQEEYNYCLKKNLEYNVINSIHILFENYEEDLNELKRTNIDINNPKLILHNLNKRMFYNDAFEYANKYLHNEIVIILHGDNFLESGFEKITKELLNKKMYPLARINNYKGQITGRGIKIKNIPDKPGDYCCSFDGFCFLSPIPENIINMSNQQQNVWGTENRLVWIFKTNDYNVITPKIFKMVHWHFTDIRPAQNNNWIKMDGTLIPNDEHQLWRQNNKYEASKIVGADLPIELGSSLMTDYL